MMRCLVIVPLLDTSLVSQIPVGSGQSSLIVPLDLWISPSLYLVVNVSDAALIKAVLGLYGAPTSQNSTNLTPSSRLLIHLKKSLSMALWTKRNYKGFSSVYVSESDPSAILHVANMVTLHNVHTIILSCLDTTSLAIENCIVDHEKVRNFTSPTIWNLHGEMATVLSEPSAINQPLTRLDIV